MKEKALTIVKRKWITRKTNDKPCSDCMFCVPVEIVKNTGITINGYSGCLLDNNNALSWTDYRTCEHWTQKEDGKKRTLKKKRT